MKYPIVLALVLIVSCHVEYNSGIFHFKLRDLTKKIGKPTGLNKHSKKVNFRSLSQIFGKLTGRNKYSNKLKPQEKKKSESYEELLSRIKSNPKNLGFVEFKQGKDTFIMPFLTLTCLACTPSRKCGIYSLELETQLRFQSTVPKDSMNAIDSDCISDMHLEWKNATMNMAELIGERKCRPFLKRAMKANDNRLMPCSNQFSLELKYPK